MHKVPFIILAGGNGKRFNKNLPKQYVKFNNYNFIERIIRDISNIKDIFRAEKNDITFLNSSKYKGVSLKSNASACITTSDLSKYLPKNCMPIIVDNVLLSSAKVSKLFYPDPDSCQEFPDGLQ